MDNSTHTLWGLTFVRRLSLFFPVVLFSNLPDILSLPFYIFYLIKDKFPVKGVTPKEIKQSLHEWVPPIEYMEFYRFFHSIIGLIIMTAVFNVFFPSFTTVFALCYALHIAVDMLTHGGYWATRILYPFSDFHLTWTKSYWHDKNTIRFNYVLLVIININILILQHYFQMVPFL